MFFIATDVAECEQLYQEIGAEAAKTVISVAGRTPPRCG